MDKVLAAMHTEPVPPTTHLVMLPFRTFFDADVPIYNFTAIAAEADCRIRFGVVEVVALRISHSMPSKSSPRCHYHYYIDS